MFFKKVSYSSIQYIVGHDFLVRCNTRNLLKEKLTLSEIMEVSFNENSQSVYQGFKDHCPAFLFSAERIKVKSKPPIDSIPPVVSLPPFLWVRIKKEFEDENITPFVQAHQRRRNINEPVNHYVKQGVQLPISPDIFHQGIKSGDIKIFSAFFPQFYYNDFLPIIDCSHHSEITIKKCPFA